MRLKQKNSIVYLDLNHLENHDGIEINLQSKRVDLKVKKGYHGVIVIQNVSHHHQLANVEINGGSEVEIIVLNKCKIKSDYSTKIKLKKDSKCRYVLLSQSNKETTHKMLVNLQKNTDLDLAILDLDKADNHREVICELNQENAKVNLDLALLAAKDNHKYYK